MIVILLISFLNKVELVVCSHRKLVVELAWTIGLDTEVYHFFCCHKIKALKLGQKPFFLQRFVIHFVAKSNYFRCTQTSLTRPIIDGIRSSVTYSSIIELGPGFSQIRAGIPAYISIP